MENAARDSLIAIDELGRGSSNEEGVGFCFALLEHFLQTGAFVIAATHFHDLQTLHRMYYNVTLYVHSMDCTHAVTRSSRSYKFATGDGEQLQLTHKLVEQEPGIDEYGIAVAEQHGFLPEVIAIARQVVQNIDEVSCLV